VGFRVRRRTGFRSEQKGQTLVVVALAVTVLLGAVALGIDWGYGLTQRRVMQNAADSAALGAAKLLASRVIGTSSGPRFIVTGDAVYCEAERLADLNREPFRPSALSRTESLTVQWSADLNAANPWASPTGGSFGRPAGGCGAPPITTGTTVPATARYIRVEPLVAYRALIAGAVTSTNSITASAHAVAALRGAPLPEDGPTWPLTRHYTPDALTESCGTPCNPTTATPVLFWSSGGGSDIDFGSFQGMVTYSRYSSRVAGENGGGPSCYGTPTPATCVRQLINHWDDSGPPSSPRSNIAGDTSNGGSAQVNCSPDNAKWITWGNDLSGTGTVSGDDRTCSIPNWATKPFGDDGNNPNTGSLRVNVPEGVSVDAGSLRLSVCGAGKRPPAPLDSPSCDTPSLGDWVETQGGNTGQYLSAALALYIAQHGATDEFANVSCTPSICSGGAVYGKHVTVLVYLWDCGQEYQGNNTWAMLYPKGGSPSNRTDCSAIHRNSDISPQSVDRVHLFTIVPFTFYEGLVNSSRIGGFWGGLVSGDPGCPTCVLNAFSNAVVLVGD
jgi:Flp pilus assembly protein TadG